jgi:hypothetical protein
MINLIIVVCVALFLAKKQQTIEERYTKPCTYWDYILPAELTKLQRGREGLFLFLIIDSSND